MAIAGASRYITAVTLGNESGTAATTSSLLGGSAGGALDASSLLDIARSNSVSGIGLSASARALNKTQIANSQGLYNGLFSATTAGGGSIEGLQTQIAALRSSLPESSLATNQRAVTDQAIELSQRLRGSQVNTTA